MQEELRWGGSGRPRRRVGLGVGCGAKGVVVVLIAGLDLVVGAIVVVVAAVERLRGFPPARAVSARRALFVKGPPLVLESKASTL